MIMADDNQQSSNSPGSKKAKPARAAEAVGAIAPAGFVDRLVADPAAPPVMVLLSGYPGSAAKEDHMRLYLTPDLAFWLDIPNEAVLHILETPADKNPLGAVTVWVRSDAAASGGNRWAAAAPERE